MYVIRALNVNSALPQGASLLANRGVARPSRYGDVIELDEPVATHYENPLERVLFSARRRANPFLHLFEALWILAGRQDVAFLLPFAKRMAEFSDDGIRFHAAYGARLRRWEDEAANGFLDQLDTAAQMLKRDAGSRRVVCSIWRPEYDLAIESKDIPCNDTIKFEARSGRLNMTVFNRSNDMVWGTYGANAVQFAFILEYVAAMAGLPVGWYEQVSCNFHAYTATMADPVVYHQDFTDPYCAAFQPVPLVDDPETFDSELRNFLDYVQHPDDRSTSGYNNTFLHEVARPLADAHWYYRQGQRAEALHMAKLCDAPDWKLAAEQWLGSAK